MHSRHLDRFGQFLLRLYQADLERVLAERQLFQTHFQGTFVSLGFFNPLSDFVSRHAFGPKILRQRQSQSEHADPLDGVIHSGVEMDLLDPDADAVAHDRFDLRLQRRDADNQGEVRFQELIGAGGRFLLAHHFEKFRSVHLLQSQCLINRQSEFVVASQGDESGFPLHLQHMGHLQSEGVGQFFHCLLGFDREPVIRRNTLEQFNHEDMVLAVLIVGLRG